MKKVIWLASLMPLLVSGQVMYDFESGMPPGWIQCPENQWIADNYLPLNGDFSLHHVYDDPAAGTARAGFRTENLRPSLGTTRWSFKLRHGYDPSASNNWAFYLMGDDEPCMMAPGSAINGFAIGVNLSGYDDTLRLWKIKNGTHYPVISTGVNWQNMIGTQDFAVIAVERSPEGLWKITISDCRGSLLRSTEAIDSELFEALWCGISYRYSSTRDRLLWIDDIMVNGIFTEDRRAPLIKSVIATSVNVLEITLDEEPDQVFSEPANFMLNGVENSTVSVARKASCRFEIRFSENLKNKAVNHLTVRSLCDRRANCVRDTVCSFTVALAEPGDIVITEIMADPLPVVSLPAGEFIEIHNCSEFTFNLSRWTLRTDDRSVEFPEYTFLPGQYLVICSQSDSAIFSGYPDVIGLKPFPALTDDGRRLALFDVTGGLIHGVDYSGKWYGNSLKSGGGWSLEMVDTGYPFNYNGNWLASCSPDGGTPGRENSVKGSCVDRYFEGIENLFPTDSKNLLLKLSEPLKTTEKLLPQMIRSDLKIESVSVTGILNKEFIIKLTEPLAENVIHTIELQGEVIDFAGNMIIHRNYSFGMPVAAAGQDILFNEILFNPFPGDPDYIELFNNSDKIIDLSGLCIASVSVSSADTSAPLAVATEQRCFLPGEYYACTTAKEQIISRYFCSGKRRLFEVPALPSMPDDRGNIVLFNRQLDVVDALIYSDDMHFPLLSGEEGIALEKVRTDFSSGERNNWHSASETSGWGTPGAPNSLLSDKAETEASLVLSSTRITPDNDGIEDLLIIDLSFPEPGNVVNVSVFDETGGFIAKPADSLFANMTASVVWDGRSEDGSLVRRGIYVIMIIVHDDKGRVCKWKRACAVLR